MMKLTVLLLLAVFSVCFAAKAKIRTPLNDVTCKARCLKLKVPNAEKCATSCACINERCRPRKLKFKPYFECEKQCVRDVRKGIYEAPGSTDGPTDAPTTRTTAPPTGENFPCKGTRIVMPPLGFDDCMTHSDEYKIPEYMRNRQEFCRCQKNSCKNSKFLKTEAEGKKCIQRCANKHIEPQLQDYGNDIPHCTKVCANEGIKSIFKNCFEYCICYDRCEDKHSGPNRIIKCKKECKHEYNHICKSQVASGCPNVLKLIDDQDC